MPSEVNSESLAISLYLMVCVTVGSRMYLERKRFPMISKKTEIKSYITGLILAIQSTKGHRGLCTYRIREGESLIDIWYANNIGQGSATDAKTCNCSEDKACISEVLLFKHANIKVWHGIAQQPLYHL